MNDFSWYAPTRFVFRKGASTHVGEELSQLGVKRVLVVYGQGSVVKLGTLDKVTDSLKAAGIEYQTLGGVRPNPEVGLVRQGIALAKEFAPQLVLAVGGGSVIDCSKAIATGCAYDGDVWDFFSGKAQPSQVDVVPIACVLTIPAAGSEASDSCVISNDELSLKSGMHGDIIRPRIAFMDPELTFTLPPYQTAAGATDMVAHICERWFSGVGLVQVTDYIAAGLIKSILADVPVALADPSNYEARSDLMWAGTLAHNGLAGAGRSVAYEFGPGGWESHAMEHELSAHKTEVTHGAGLAVIMPAWMHYVWREDPQRFVDFGRMVFDMEPSAGEESLDSFVEEVINRLQEHFVSWGMPANLTELGFVEDDVEALLTTLKINRGESFGVFKPLTMEDAGAIYRSAL